jgi:hypothetical protein
VAFLLARGFSVQRAAISGDKSMRASILTPGSDFARRSPVIADSAQLDLGCLFVTHDCQQGRQAESLQLAFFLVAWTR